jgi:hypothetical protein
VYAIFGWAKRIAIAATLISVIYVVADHNANRNRFSLGGESDAWTFGAAPSNGAGAEICTFFSSPPPALTSSQLGQVRCDANQISMVSAQGLDSVASTPAANPVMQGERNSTGVSYMISCDKYAQASITTNATTNIVLGVSAKTVYLCGYDWYTSSAQTLTFETGTGAACASGSPALATLVGPFTGAPQAGKVSESPSYNGLSGPVNAGICVLTAGTTGNTVVEIHYAQF